MQYNMHPPPCSTCIHVQRVFIPAHTRAEQAGELALIVYSLAPQQLLHQRASCHLLALTVATKALAVSGGVVALASAARVRNNAQRGTELVVDVWSRHIVACIDLSSGVAEGDAGGYRALRQLNAAVAISATAAIAAARR